MEENDSSNLLTPLSSFPTEDDGRFGNSHMRWTILYAVIIFLIATMPIWISLVYPFGASYVISLFIGLIHSMWLTIAYNSLINFSKLNSSPIPSVDSLEVTRNRLFTHIVVVPCYLDPIDVLFDCLGSLLLQTDPTNLLVVVAFEAKTPDLLIKEHTITSAFRSKFTHFITTIHTVDHSREIAGGCSNKNYALHEVYKYIQNNSNKFNKHSITITTCDTDSLFNPKYFEILENCYNSVNKYEITNLNPPKMVVWQSPLFYNWDLDKRPFFNRITCIIRSMMMLGGLIGWNLNPMSVFSYPLELGLKVGQYI